MVTPSDARLRRAQALAGESEIGLAIAKELISQKLIGQQRVALSSLWRKSELLICNLV